MGQEPSPGVDLSHTGVRKLYERAVESFDAGDFRQAEAFLEELIEREPGHGYAYWYLARVKEQKGQAEEALFYWKTCALLNDGRLDWVDGVYGKLADFLGRHRRLEELHAFLGDAARRDPACPTVHRHLAGCAERLGRKSEAVTHMLRCLALVGDPATKRELQERVMNLCIELGDLEMLEVSGRSLLESDPGSVRAHYLLSRYHEKRGHLGKAIAHLKKSLPAADDPRCVEVSLELAALQKKAGKAREALRTLTRGEHLCEHPFALWLLAECHEELGDAPQALSAWRRAAEAFGPTTREGREAFFAYVETLIDLGREEEAKAQLERAPEAIRGSDRARRYLAEANERTGELAMARVIWEELLGTCVPASRERAAALLSVCRILMAEGEAERALGLLSGEDLESLRDPDLFGVLAEVREDLGQEELAVLAWERAEQLVRHDRRRVYELKLARAELLLKLDRFEESVELLASVAPRHGREERHYLLEGQALAELGQHERALLSWERLAQSPRPRVRREGLVRMGQLLRDLGRLDEAVSCYERLIADGHDLRAGLLGLAEIAEERRDYGKAHTLWDALAEMYEGSSALAVRARSRAAGARELGRVKPHPFPKNEPKPTAVLRPPRS